MHRFMIRFQGLPIGWAGKQDIYTITVTTDQEQFTPAVVTELRKTHQVDKVLYHRKLK